jgi:hypothetical protein
MQHFLQYLAFCAAVVLMAPLVQGTPLNHWLFYVPVGVAAAYLVARLRASRH